MARVEPVRHFPGQRLVHPAQEFGCGEPEGGVSPHAAEVDTGAFDSEDRRETGPEGFGLAFPRRDDHMHMIGRDVLGPRLKDGHRVVHVPEPRPAPAVDSRLGTYYPVEPLFPGDRTAAFNPFLPFRRKKGRVVPDGEDDVHLGREQRPDRAVGLPGGAGRQQLIGNDGRPAGTQGLARQDVPFAGPRLCRVRSHSLRLAQVPAGAGMVPVTVAGQQDPAGGQPRLIAPQRILEERRAGLRLPDVQVHAGTAGALAPAARLAGSGPYARNPARIPAVQAPCREDRQV